MSVLPTTWMSSPFFWAWTSNVTEFVVAFSVRSPVAVAVTCVPSAGAAPSSMGAVSTNVAVGNCAVSRRLLLNWPSRRASSLVTVVMSTVNVAAVTWVPEIVMSPVTALVRPTPSVSTPNSTSTTRYPTVLLPLSIVQGPSAPEVASPPPAAGAVSAAPAGSLAAGASVASGAGVAAGAAVEAGSIESSVKAGGASSFTRL